MKYWRGFLVAGILGACTWGLLEFAKTHTVLIDMVFPYISRMLCSSAAQWSASVSFCLWQVLLVGIGVGVLAFIALAVALRWNLIQVTGWIAAVASLVVLFHTGIFGMNKYSGPLSDDIHLEIAEYDFVQLEKAATYYLENAVALEQTILSAGGAAPDFEALAEAAWQGYNALVYSDSYSVFAGSRVPVKKLGWKSYYTENGITGVTVSLTGESAVNPDVPEALLPFAICHEMAHRMSIHPDRDANLAAFLGCRANENPYFAYSGYLNAYRYCYNALKSFSSEAATSATTKLSTMESAKITADIEAIDRFYGDAEDSTTFRENVQLLVSWYLQEIYFPVYGNDGPAFDPLDETQVDLSGNVNAKPSVIG